MSKAHHILQFSMQQISYVNLLEHGDSIKTVIKYCLSAYLMKVRYKQLLDENSHCFHGVRKTCGSGFLPFLMKQSKYIYPVLYILVYNLAKNLTFNRNIQIVFSYYV